VNRNVTGPIIGAGGLIWAAGMCLAIVECVKWLKDGFWSASTLPRMFGPIGESGWGGLDQIIQWVWVQPLWAVVAFAGMAVAGLGFGLERN
jgi:hypothetical protein